MDIGRHSGLPMDAHRASHIYPPEVIAQIQRTAAEGHYEIRGWGAKRSLPSFDDLLFLTASLTRYPLEGYREKCEMKTVLGTQYDVAPDGKRFLLNNRLGEGSAEPITVVTNWTAELKK